MDANQYDIRHYSQGVGPFSWIQHIPLRSINGSPLSPRLMGGYLGVTLFLTEEQQRVRDVEAISVKIHRLVASAFVEGYGVEGRRIVDHINGIGRTTITQTCGGRPTVRISRSLQACQWKQHQRGPTLQPHFRVWRPSMKQALSTSILIDICSTMKREHSNDKVPSKVSVELFASQEHRPKITTLKNSHD